MYFFQKVDVIRNVLKYLAADEAIYRTVSQRQTPTVRLQKLNMAFGLIIRHIVDSRCRGFQVLMGEIDSQHLNALRQIGSQSMSTLTAAQIETYVLWL